MEKTGKAKKEEKSFRSGIVALVGRPNVGKSSLINALLAEKVMAVSDKPQTTRDAVRCIYTDQEAQIVFVDTPGIHFPKNKLGELMVREAQESLYGAEVVCYVVEASDRKIGKQDSLILELLKGLKLPVFLLLNKVDLSPSKESFWKAVELYQEHLEFKEVLPISALSKVNVSLLVERLKEWLPKAPPLYPEEMLVDQTERFLAAEIIREKILSLTQQEVPHSVAVLIEEYQTPEEYPDLRNARIRATIIVERPGQKTILIGERGSKIREIGRQARLELEERIGVPLYLDLWIKVKPNWRRSQEELKRMGFVF